MNENRKEKAEKAEQITSEAIETLATALDQGKSDGLKNHLAAMARFYRYSFGNLMLIWGQREDATHVAGFREWQNKKRQVKKGEKGIMIRAPFTINKKTKSSEKEDETIFGFKAAYVFDISQTEGEEIASIATVEGLPRWSIESLKTFATTNGIEVKYDEHLPMEGQACDGLITLRANLSPAEEFSTFVHELAHTLLHFNNDGRSVSRSVVETEAEAVAYVVSTAAGLDAVQASADYIRLYQGSSATLWESLSRIQKTAARIIRNLDE